MNDELPYMPLYVRDVLAETAAMDPEERGVYLTLVLHLWLEGGRLTTDSARLARLVGMPEDRLRTVWDQIGHRFKTGDGHFTHPLVTDQLVKSRKALQDRRRGADATNAKRAAQRDAQRDAERALTESPSVAPSATHSETLGEAGATKLSLSASPSCAPSETLSARSAGRNQSQIPKSDPIQSQSERQGGAGETPAPAGPDLGEIPREAQHQAMEQILTSTRRAS